MRSCSCTYRLMGRSCTSPVRMLFAIGVLVGFAACRSSSAPEELVELPRSEDIATASFHTVPGLVDRGAVLAPLGDSWMSGYVGAPTVSYDGSRFRMYFGAMCQVNAGEFEEVKSYSEGLVPQRLNSRRRTTKLATSSSEISSSYNLSPRTFTPPDSTPSPPQPD